MDSNLFIFAGITAALIVVEHRTLYARLRGNELARWVVGVLSVLLPAAAFVPSGSIAWDSWLMFAAGFAGAGLARLVTAWLDEEAARQRRAQQLRHEVETYAEETGE